MSNFRHKIIFLQVGFGFLLVYSAIATDGRNIESEGFLPVLDDSTNKYDIEGSGGDIQAVQSDNVVTNVDIEVKEVHPLSLECDCSKFVTTDKQLYHNNQEPVVIHKTPSAVIVIIVILSILVLVSIVTIAILLGKVKYLNMRQSVPVPSQSSEDYDSDEYSVMMDWNEPNIIVKSNKPKKKAKMNGH